MATEPSTLIDLAALARAISDARYKELAADLNACQLTREPEARLSTRRSPLLESFASAEKLAVAIEKDDPVALVAALELLTHHGPTDAESMALSLLKTTPFQILRNKSLVLLGYCPTEAAFRALAADDNSYALRLNQFSGAQPIVLEEISKLEVLERYRHIRQPSLNEWLALSDTEQRRFRESVEAAYKELDVGEIQRAQAHLSYIGQHGIVLDEGWLTLLLEQHPAGNVRLGVCYALREQELLANRLLTSDPKVDYFALEAHVSRDPKTAAARLRSALQRANLDFTQDPLSRLLVNLLNLFIERTDLKTGRCWLESDPGWLSILLECSQASQYRELKRSCLELTKRFPASEVKAAKAAAKLTEMPKSDSKKAPLEEPAQKRPLRGEKLLADFEKGKGHLVWKRLEAKDLDLNALSPHVEEIAAETMRRVRTGVERAAERLSALGYVFLADTPVETISSSIDEELAELQESAGTLPVALEALLRHVGGVNFCGYHPDWPVCHVEHPGYHPKRAAVRWYTNPIVLPTAAELLEELEVDGDVHNLILCGDELAKAGISGGSYELIVPDACADPVLEGARKQTLVGHLRLCLKFAGFAGMKGLRTAPKELFAELNEARESF